MSVSSVADRPGSNLEEVWQARVDLTVALRWAAKMALNEGVCNHFSLVVPGTTDRFLLNPQGLHWSEIRASDLIVVDPDGNVVEGNYTVEPTAFYIHSRIHLAKPEAKCVLHTHMPYATALCCVEGGRLEWASQNALRYYGRVGYDDRFNGVALDAAEGDRMCAELQDNDILFLANHGVIAAGSDVATTFDDLYYLERACLHQVLAQSTGLPLKVVPQDICELTARQIAGEKQQAYLHFESLKRMLERDDPDFMT